MYIAVSGQGVLQGVTATWKPNERYHDACLSARHAARHPSKLSHAFHGLSWRSVPHTSLEEAARASHSQYYNPQTEASPSPSPNCPTPSRPNTTSSELSVLLIAATTSSGRTQAPRSKYPLPEARARCRRRHPHPRYQVVMPLFSSSHLALTTTTVIELLAKRVWYRTQARIQRIRGASPETPTTRPSPTTKLPQEIIEAIIAFLANDTRSLRACCLTCYSWYIAAVPHLHSNLLISEHFFGRRFRWPNPIRHMHALGLLPFVRTFWFGTAATGGDIFSPKQFNHRTLRQFSALANVQKLMIDHLDIPSFMPRVQQHFGHFLPTLRELYLRKPKGSRRQILYFIGMFKHLEDLELRQLLDVQEELAGDLTPAPPFVPPLRGRLRLWYFRRADFLETMIDLFGGIRFRRMDLFGVDGVPLLLGACAKTLETLLLYPRDPHSERLPPNICVSQPTNLQPCPPFGTSIYRGTSRFEHSRPRRTPWAFSGCRLGPSQVLSAVTSPSFFEVVVRYRWYDFGGVGYCWQYQDLPPLHELLRADRAAEVLQHHMRFKVFREVREVQDFLLVPDANVWGPAGNIRCKCGRRP